jgi:hypothetical protein
MGLSTAHESASDMKYRIALLLAAMPLALAGCMNDAPTQRPRLLAQDEARIGDLNWLDTRHVSLDQQQVRIVHLELTSCSQAPATSTMPRLVIGEPVCVFGAKVGARRID